MPPARSVRRLLVPRYGEVPGLPAKAMVITNSERMELGCDRRWFHRYAEHLRPEEEARALTYGSGWSQVMEDLHRWWMVHDSRYPLEQVIGRGSEDTSPAGSCPWCSTGTPTGRSTSEWKCAECEDSTFSVLFRLRREWLHGVTEEGEDAEEAHENVATLFRALLGYCEVYSAHPSTEYRVVAVEVMVSAPIVDPETGKPFRPRLPLVETGDGWRIAEPGETPTTWGSWPWFQIGKLDVVLQHRVTGALWVEDGKSSRDAPGYLRNVTVDPQTTGYVWMLQEAIQGERVPFKGDVVGVQWDVASSSLQHYPRRLVDKPVSKTEIAAQEKAVDEMLLARPEVAEKVATAAATMKKKELADYTARLLTEGEIGAERERRLAAIVRWKPPELSKATNVTTPSWLYLEAIQSAAPTPDGQRVKLEDYQDHLSWCRENVDVRLYAREPVVASPQAVEEYRWEIIGIARKIAASIVAAVKVDSPERLAVAFPRTPLCRKPGGSCPFVSLCAGGDPTEARAEFTTSEGLRWEKPEASKTATSTADPSTATDDLGF